MKDLALDIATHDLKIEGYDYTYVYDDAWLEQKLKIKLQTFRKEAALNLDAGIDYYGLDTEEQAVFTKNPKLGAIAAMFKIYIINTYIKDKNGKKIRAVIEITDFKMDLDAPKRKLFIEFEVNTIYGVIRVSTGDL
jgi:hypothetical protein